MYFCTILGGPVLSSEIMRSMLPSTCNAQAKRGSAQGRLCVNKSLPWETVCNKVCS